MARLPLHTLPTFLVVARLANLRAAADQLHLTHSAVSQQIKLLEEQIGFPLFDRAKRRLTLNSAGAALLRAATPALAQLDQGLRAATAAAVGEEQRVRMTVLPSFAQRWLLPRMNRWREQHPDIVLDIEATPALVDLQRDGFHVGLRQGTGKWRGLSAEPLFESLCIVVATPEIAQRLAGHEPARILHEALLGDLELWQAWFEASGITQRPRPVAAFNDFGLMLQAAEQGLGVAIARELLAADALREGRLVQVSPHRVNSVGPNETWFVHPPQLADWPPLLRLRDWLKAELARSAAELAAGPPAITPASRRRRAR